MFFLAELICLLLKIVVLKSQLQKSNLLRLRRRYTPRNDCKDAICLCERSEAIPLLNAFAITS